MDVSIIMINYNTFDLTKNAIESITDNTQNISYEIILIDNASPDNSGENLFKYFGDKIIYIQSGENSGTSKAFNLGVKQAQGKYVLWLNTDILVKDNFIYILYNYMEGNGSCGICGGNLLDFNNKPTHSYLMELPSVKSVKKGFSLCNIIINKLFHNKIKREYNFSDTPKEVGYITGADMMIRKSIIDEIGGFDEDIFMYAEESEFTFRMKKMTEYKAFSVPTAIMQHLEGASFGKQNKFNEWRFKTKLNGDCVYFDKCYGQPEMIKYLKVLNRSYLKLSIISRLLFRREKADMFKRSREIIKARIKEVY